VESVRLTRLDAILPELLERERVNHVFLKSDTQGYDLYVIRGASGVIDSIPAIQTEVSFQAQYRNAPRFDETFGYLSSLGYLPIGLFPVDRDDRGRLIECDLVMSR
jgi:hypothetical protein